MIGGFLNQTKRTDKINLTVIKPSKLVQKIKNERIRTKAKGKKGATDGVEQSGGGK